MNLLFRFCILMFTYFACFKDGDHRLHFNMGVTYLGFKYKHLCLEYIFLRNDRKPQKWNLFLPLPPYAHLPGVGTFMY